MIDKIKLSKKLSYGACIGIGYAVIAVVAIISIGVVTVTSPESARFYSESVMGILSWLTVAAVGIGGAGMFSQSASERSEHYAPPETRAAKSANVGNPYPPSP